MKKLIALLSLTFSFAVAANSLPKWNSVPVDGLYVPAGFDSNDNVQVIVTGYLPNLCFKEPSATVTKKGRTINISMEAREYIDPTSFCIEMIVPFVETVSLGLLDKGKYDIKLEGAVRTNLKAEMGIQENETGLVDDFVYAQVNRVKQIEGTRKIKLYGFNPSDCLELDKVEFVSNGKDALAVLPKMKQVRDFCPRKLVPFQYEVEVPSTLSADRILLHVRSMEGKSINAFFANR